MVNFGRVLAEPFHGHTKYTKRVATKYENMKHFAQITRLYVSSLRGSDARVVVLLHLYENWSESTATPTWTVLSGLPLNASQFRTFE
jgi:hypothetical protein